MICIAAPGFAQSGEKFPSRPIKMIVAFAAGGSSDILARTIAQQFSLRTGSTMVVENKPGASSAIAMEYVAKAAPDGYTLLWGSDSTVLQPLMHKDFPVDPMRDLTPLTKLGVAPSVISVKAGLPVNSIKELIDLAKSKPGALHYGHGGIGGTHHLAFEEFNHRAGINIGHVPYKGTAPLVTDTLAGNLDVAVTGTVEVAKYAAPGGLIRVLAVMGEKRAPSMPNVPTMIESGFPGLTSGSWFGVLGPKGLPPQAADFLTKNIMAAAETPEFRKIAATLDMPVEPTSGPDTVKFMVDKTARFKETIARSGFKLN